MVWCGQRMERSRCLRRHLGPGLRVDSYAYAGYSTNPRFDSLVSETHRVIRPQPSFAETVNKAYRALCKFRIEGVATNVGFLQALLQHPDFRANRLHTGFVEEKISRTGGLGATQATHRQLVLCPATPNTSSRHENRE